MHRFSYFTMLPFNFTYSQILKIIFSAKLDRCCNLREVPLPGPTNEFQQHLVSTIIGTYMYSNVITWVSYSNTYKLDDLNKKSLHHKPKMFGIFMTTARKVRTRFWKY